MLSAYLATQMSWNFPLLIFFLSILLLYSSMYIYRKYIISNRLQPFLFCTGILLLYGMLGTPLLSLSYLSFSLHMIQMSVIYFVVPPLLLLGIPSLANHNTKFNRFSGKISTLSMYALTFFAILFLFYHLPFVFTFISQRDAWQKLYVILLFILAILMWMPIAKKNIHTTPLKQKKFLKWSSMLIMPACLIFIISAFIQEMNNPFLTDIATHLCLPSEHLKILPSPFNTKYDQIFSGIIMLSIHQGGMTVTKKLNLHLYRNK